jgi:hypothetical protein
VYVTVCPVGDDIPHFAVQNDLLISSCAKQAYLSRKIPFYSVRGKLETNLHESNVEIS